jgi:hypothetical protein
MIMNRVNKFITILLGLFILQSINNTVFAGAISDTMHVEPAVADCYTAGTIIWKEDFGGNEVSDPFAKPEGIPQVTGYTYVSGFPVGGGTYSIQKVGQPHGGWYEPYDHTFPDDPERGYLVQFDATYAAGQHYECEIDNLCSGSRLYFSAWLMSVQATDAPDKTNQTFLMEDLNGNILNSYDTGDLPDLDPVWKRYGFEFAVPSGQSSVVLRILNNGKGSIGNDFVLDDIEIRLCTPPVDVTPDEAPVCAGSQVVLTGTYTDDGIFGANLLYKWIFSKTGNINDPSEWKDVSVENSSNNGKVSSTFNIPAVDDANTGYYRLIVSNRGNINNYNCRAMSDLVHVSLSSPAPSTVGSDQTICYDAVPSQLSSTDPSAGSAFYTYQWEQSTDNGNTWSDVSGGSGASTLNYNPPALKITTKYRLRISMSSCNPVYSNVVTITVHEQLAGGTIGSNQTICYNTAPAAFTNTTSPSGGTGLSYLWQSSTTNGTNWTDISSATGLTYTSGALLQTTQFRRRVTNSCGTAYSNVITVTVYEELKAGIIGNDTTICYNTTPATIISLISPSGGDNSYSYQWQKREDNTSQWQNITDGTGNDEYFTPSALTSTTYYRRIVTSCRSVESNIVTIAVLSSSFNNYPDIRAEVCPNKNDINLGKYLDSTEVKTVLWKKISGADISSDGIIIARDLLSSNIHTYEYTIENTCVSGVSRRFYVHLHADGVEWEAPKDTVIICCEQKDAIQMNQLFGIDSDGKWEYGIKVGDSLGYIVELSSHIRQISISPYTGALIFDGQAAYFDNSIPVTTYNGVPSKQIIFKYKTAPGCMKGKEYTKVIVLIG